MKNNYLTLPALLFLLCFPAFAQSPLSINLYDALQRGDMEVYNRDISLLDEPSHQGIRLSKAEGEGVAWLKGIAFSEGIIEFEVRGENIKQHSFVGIAFHGKDNETFDAVYLRPFQFQEKNEVLQRRSIQYIALPEFTWRKLREHFPLKYEAGIDPAPDPNDWVKVRIEVEADVVSTYINGSKEPNLRIEKVSKTRTGAIGLYVADTSGGDFANLRITINK